MQRTTTLSFLTVLGCGRSSEAGVSSFFPPGAVFTLCKTLVKSSATWLSARLFSLCTSPQTSVFVCCSFFFLLLRVRYSARNRGRVRNGIRGKTTYCLNRPLSQGIETVLPARVCVKCVRHKRRHKCKRKPENQNQSAHCAIRNGPSQTNDTIE